MSRKRCSSFWVLYVPAEKMTWSAVNVRSALRVEPLAGANGVDRVATVLQRAHVRHGRQRVHRGAAALGQGEVVGGQRVLRAVPAAGHALAALDAAGALGAGAAEERVGDGLARLLLAVAAEEHADRRQVERVGLAELRGQALHLRRWG